MYKSINAAKFLITNNPGTTPFDPSHEGVLSYTVEHLNNENQVTFKRNEVNVST